VRDIRQDSENSLIVFAVTVNLPASESIEYKYIKKDSSESVIWESDPNNALMVPSGGTFTTDDTWR
jgi:glucoamylase